MVLKEILQGTHFSYWNYWEHFDAKSIQHQGALGIIIIIFFLSFFHKLNLGTINITIHFPHSTLITGWVTKTHPLKQKCIYCSLQKPCISHIPLHIMWELSTSSKPHVISVLVWSFCLHLPDQFFHLQSSPLIYHEPGSSFLYSSCHRESERVWFERRLQSFNGTKP